MSSFCVRKLNCIVFSYALFLQSKRKGIKTIIITLKMQKLKNDSKKQLKENNLSYWIYLIRCSDDRPVVAQRST